MRNTPAFWQLMKGELLKSTPVTDRVPVKAGPKVKGSFDISKGELMHLNVDAVVYNKMMPQLLLDQKTHKKHAHGISVCFLLGAAMLRGNVCVALIWRSLVLVLMLVQSKRAHVWAPVCLCLCSCSCVESSNPLEFVVKWVC